MSKEIVDHIDSKVIKILKSARNKSLRFSDRERLYAQKSILSELRKEILDNFDCTGYDHNKTYTYDDKGGLNENIDHGN